MTIGIAVCLADGALLIADGKKSELSPKSRIVKDDTDKIRRIGKTVGAITLGIDIVTNTVVNILKRDNVIDSTCSSPEEIMREIERIMAANWNCYLRNLPSVIDRNQMYMRAGLLVGGFVGDINFISGVLFRPDAHESPKIETQPLTCIVLGGEEHNSQSIFEECIKKLSEELQKKGNNEELQISSLISAGVLTIKIVEDKDPTFGGKIKCVTIRRGLLYCESFV